MDKYENDRGYNGENQCFDNERTDLEEEEEKTQETNEADLLDIDDLLPVNGLSVPVLIPVNGSSNKNETESPEILCEMSSPQSYRPEYALNEHINEGAHLKSREDGNAHSGILTSVISQQNLDRLREEHENQSTESDVPVLVSNEKKVKSKTGNNHINNTRYREKETYVKYANKANPRDEDQADSTEKYEHGYNVPDSQHGVDTIREQTLHQPLKGRDLLPGDSQNLSREERKTRRKIRKKKVREPPQTFSGTDDEYDKQRPHRHKKKRKHTRTDCENEMAVRERKGKDIDLAVKETSEDKYTRGDSISSKEVQNDDYKSGMKEVSGHCFGERTEKEESGDIRTVETSKNDRRENMTRRGTVDIFTVGNSYNQISEGLDNKDIDISQIRTKKKKKTKKKLHGLKKTRGAVGILPETEATHTKVKADGDRQPLEEVSDKIAGSEKALEVKLIDADKTRQQERPAPLLLCRIIAGYPLTSFFVVSLVHLAVFGTTAGLVFSGYDVFPLVFDSLPLYIYEDVHLKELTWKSRTRYPGYIWRPVYGANIPRGTRSQVKDTVEVIFERPGVNLLDKAHLDWIKLAEERLFNIPLYQVEYCLLDYDRNCVKPQSILRFFDGTYSDVDPVFTDPDFSNVIEVIYKAYMYNETRDYLNLFLGKNSIITPTFVSTDITRSVFAMGWPLGIVNVGGRYVYGSLETLEDFLSDVFRAEIEYIRDELLVDLIDVYYLSKMLYELDLVQQALKDIMLAIGSVSFIFVFMCFQTRSIIITFLGVMSIASSFLLTNLIYRYVFQYLYFGFFHVIAMFLILGIGADDLFVFYDTWRLTGKTKYPSDAHRLSDCYRRAAKTTFVTSCTTMVAFLVSGLSPLLPVRTFGIFSGVLVAINYLWVIIYFPSIIMIHHTKVKLVWHKFYTAVLSLCLSKNSFSNHGTGRRRKSTISTISSETNSSRQLIDQSQSETTEDANSATKHDYETKRTTEKIYKQNNEKNVALDIHEENHNADLIDITIAPTKDVEKDVRLDLRQSQADAIRHTIFQKREQKERRDFQDRNRLVRFLKKEFFIFMTSRVVKIVTPLLILGISIFFIHRATLIEPDTQQLRLFRDDHNYAKATERHYTAFIRNNEDEYQRVYLIWGLLPADISSCNIKSATYCFGNPLYDATFDMNTPEAQIAFKGLCKYLDNLPDTLVNSLHIRRDTISGKPQISCFTKPMEQFFQIEAEKNTSFGTKMYPDDMRIEIPITSGNVSMLMSNNFLIYRTSLPNDFSNYFEIPVSYWLTNGYTLSPTPDYFLYNNLLAEKKMPFTAGAYYATSGLYYGTKLQYMAVEINTTLNLYQLGYKEGLPIYENWENFIININAGFPEPLKRGMQVAETLWHWLHVQETLAQSAFTGILVGLTSALPILVFTTFNFVIGTIATVTIGLVTACVVGLIPLVGWKLGVLESINLCMVVGLSVDYVVHLAEAYRMSDSPKRLDRVHNMLESIGLSVISGAITTIGAAIFMLFAQIRFFYQFGIFIISTVGISLVFSLFGYTTFMSICGPQGDFGNLKHMAKTIKKYCRAEQTGSSRKRWCMCASPSVVLDRIYDRIGYGKSEY